MRLVEIVWFATLVLSLTSLAAMLCLVAARVARSAAQARKVRLQSQLTRALLAAMRQGGDVDFAALRGRRRDELGEILVDLLGKLRGAERERLVEIARQARLPEYFTRQIVRGRAARRASAVEALSEMPIDGTPALLSVALEDPDSEVRIAAARGLMHLGAPVPMRRLLEALAVPALGISERVLALLSRATADDRNELASIARDAGLPLVVRVLAVRALENAGDFFFVGTLGTLAGDGPTDLRVAAFRALGALGHPSAQAAVAGGLGDADAEVRAAAAEAAGRIRLTSLVSELDGLLSDEDGWVGLSAAEALRQLGPVGQARLARRLDERGHAETARSAGKAGPNGHAA